MRREELRSAVALRYLGKMDEVPTVAARGEAAAAEEIIKIAKRFGVPVVEDPQLAAELLRLSEGEHIPVRLFEVVAVLLRSLISLPFVRTCNYD